MSSSTTFNGEQLLPFQTFVSVDHGSLFMTITAHENRDLAASVMLTPEIAEGLALDILYRAKLIKGEKP